CQHYYSTPYNF
nr:immunoglobulin light chain junction region [Macaca mulatta]MPN91867.1 immunoglobulin light chain junction region [Macaca mulatta]MPN92763.1 immunoglobulin light chain junction region [Macaca mulatta]MPN96128.1 immunoglobulin light chain junction region [Macaca mulatta]MPN96451.1 immunoglobulin light chain junction region [Macaca mulatta]